MKDKYAILKELFEDAAKEYYLCAIQNQELRKEINLIKIVSDVVYRQQYNIEKGSIDKAEVLYPLISLSSECVYKSKKQQKWMGNTLCKYFDICYNITKFDMLEL